MQSVTVFMINTISAAATRKYIHVPTLLKLLKFLKLTRDFRMLMCSNSIAFGKNVLYTHRKMILVYKTSVFQMLIFDLMVYVLFVSNATLQKCGQLK